ncbi:hypothetical protein [Calditerricola satsumensis]|uniref:Uncharacterized protein n=1 Tax=Calditerricola satsumensis TaxID=373054 RepID=A0A8J3BBD4_9BACI|nr:hypothetical protein [Calditerricola satsumensis]GGJ94162.1 hypothetical protein GCM10007043_04950 [Calditerricola satsumensis]
MRNSWMPFVVGSALGLVSGLAISQMLNRTKGLDARSEGPPPSREEDAFAAAAHSGGISEERTVPPAAESNAGSVEQEMAQWAQAFRNYAPEARPM